MEAFTFPMCESFCLASDFFQYLFNKCIPTFILLKLYMTTCASTTAYLFCKNIIKTCCSLITVGVINEDFAHEDPIRSNARYFYYLFAQESMTKLCCT